MIAHLRIDSEIPWFRTNPCQISHFWRNLRISTHPVSLRHRNTAGNVANTVLSVSEVNTCFYLCLSRKIYNSCKNIEESPRLSTIRTWSRSGSDNLEPSFPREYITNPVAGCWHCRNKLCCKLFTHSLFFVQKWTVSRVRRFGRGPGEKSAKSHGSAKLDRADQ